MTEWARREDGKVVEIVTSFLPDEDFLQSRVGQDMVPIEQVPFADLGQYIQAEAQRLGQPPRPIGLVQPPVHIHEGTEIV